MGCSALGSPGNDGEAADFAIGGQLGGLNLPQNFQDRDLDNYGSQKMLCLKCMRALMKKHHDEIRGLKNTRSMAPKAT
ncbi:MAG: hypothetical protein CM15mP84_10560 [Cellvibrionales bacterium]|nr:MAG: hypothetical protein CM15mP84_10560 [Cellvibrionales bacterium]